MDAACHVYFRSDYWHWEAELPDGKVVCTVPYDSAEEAEHGMEETVAVLRAACVSFFEQRAAEQPEVEGNP